MTSNRTRRTWGNQRATTTQPRLSAWWLLGTIAVAPGCLDRPVAETNPQTQNIFVKQNKTSKIDKIDVLFMIDNSASMADKQTVLSAAVPQLLRRFTTPYCIDPKNPAATPEKTEDPQSPCKTPGYTREFSPVNDIHIGVITSSLGDMGGTRCDFDPNDTIAQSRDDKGWLLGALPRTKAGANKLPGTFLSWTASDASNFSTQIEVKENEFRNFVTAAGESGCGYEMSLESWYRFLVDPEPPLSVERVSPTDRSNMNSARVGLDSTLLQQRKEFLRPDSLLAIVMLTDENDCSLRDTGITPLMSSGASGAAATTTTALKTGAEICKTSPNDKCCYSCNLDPPAGCNVDPKCSESAPAAVIQDNLRCFDQKKRFGYDFLFPTSRYVNALKLKTICPYQSSGDLECKCAPNQANCDDGPSFPNPLYTADAAQLAAGIQPRAETSMVFLAGIVGVPWQDIATPESLTPDASLKYLPASSINWDLLLPDANGNPALDPLMRESIDARTGTHPITKEPIGLPTATQQKLNSINHHEWNTGAKDLQFACVFDLTQRMTANSDADGQPGETKDCTPCPTDLKDPICEAHIGSCSCSNTWAPKGSESPLCQNPSNNEYGTTQYFAKAYPGTRQLEVLKGHNETARDNSIVASICPKDLDYSHQDEAGYGYNPAVASLVERLKSKLVDACLLRPLIPDVDGKLSCAVVEASTDASWNAKTCLERGRKELDPALAEAVRHQMKADQICDFDGRAPCSTFQLCELKQLSDAMDPAQQPLTKCQNLLGFETESSVPGYCYVAPEQGIGSSDIVATCPAAQKRKLRLVGNGQELRAPAPGWTFFACSGAAFNDTVE